GNSLDGLAFALLADFPDADREVEPEDRALLQRVEDGVSRLNARYGRGAEGGPFLLLHRGRSWNPREGVWMGWERKRGKLAQLNDMILTGEGALEVRVGSVDRIRGRRYVITLDADTFLPQGAAARLIGTAAHPLNRPKLDPDGRVRAGYTVLQPRVETTPGSAASTRFATLFEGEKGLDLYSRAVSDVYQDLFGAGIFAGKGIYDVAAFERTLRGRVPEDAILSHDLFEGEHGRVGFVSDVAVYEDFPSHPLTFLRRLHRWVRGDWQIAGWLLPSVRAAHGARIPNAIGPLGRWKIVDNLRRSLLMPSLTLLLVAGWTWLPGPAWWWTAAGAGVPAVPLLLGALEGARTRMRVADRSILLTAAPAPFGRSVVRWIVVLVLLPYRAVLEVDAVTRTLVRVLATRRHLLQWTTAAHVARRFGAEGAPSPWRVMWIVPTLSLGLGAIVTILRPEAFPASAPLILLWLASPALARALGRTGKRAARPLTEDEVRRLRALARRTWGFFERFLGPEHQWLPPDHFQERPATGAAYRSSPTNVGLGVLSVLAAWDLGYVTLSRAGATLHSVMDAMEALPRYRGHFFNWYDTWHGTVLPPRFISTVDSGNLAAALMALARGCRTLPDEPSPRPALEAQGLLDALAVVDESARRLEARSAVALTLGPFRERIREIDGAIRKGHGSARAWARTIVALDRGALPELETAAVELVELGTRTGRVGAGAELRTTLQHLRKQNEGLIETLRAFTPWLLPDDPEGTWTSLEPVLPSRVTLRSLPDLLDGVVAGLVGDDRAGVEDELRQVQWYARALRAELEEVADRAESLLEDMDFGFLYDRQRRIFHVGYEVEADRPTPAHYDLLASEARLASFVAIARGDVPHEHWLHLGRPFGRVGGQGVLLSWSGTLFEFLMPELLLRTPGSSLLDFADRAAVDRQIAFGRKRRVPWGVSESSYHHLDHHGTYQYRAFGVPDLALRRDQDPRVVVAPYASLLAMRIRPREVVHNLERIVELDGLGLYGCYESLDFSTGGGGGTRPSVVRSWMAHHQAMSLLSLANFFTGSRMVQRFHDDPRVKAAELLLHERVPGRVPGRPAALRAPSLERGEVPPPLQAWKPRPDASLPQVQALSNGRWTTVLTDRGSSGTLYRGRDVTRSRSDPGCTCSGVWLYLQDLDDGTLWSATAAPTYVRPEVEEVVFAPHRVDFRRTVDEITSRLTVFVVPTVPVEVRRLRLTNQGPTPRRVGVTSYGEVVLAPHAEDRRHPAFVKLFVESEFRGDAATLLFHRRPGARGVEPMHAAHTVLTGAGATLVGWETDRGRFLGRAGVDAAPAGLGAGPRGLSGTVGTTLDPIYSLGCEVELPPYGQSTLSFLTSAGPSEGHALSAMESLRSPERVDWALEKVAERARLALHATGMDPGDAHLVQELLTALLLPYHNLRGRAVRHRVAPQRQPELWRHGVSGDLPVVLLRVADGDHLGRAEDVLRVHGRLFRSRIESDLVVLDESAGGYTDPVRNWLQGAVLRYHGGGWLGRTGGVHHVAGATLGEAERDTLEAVASVYLDTARGDLERQLAGVLETPARLPPLVPGVGPAHAPEPTPPLPPTGELLFDNGHGGLTADGREYVVRVDGEGDGHTPAPWLNVIANPRFGFTVSERGAGFTWAGNSGEHRLTPWSNDPVRDRPGEALYLRDEETAEVWSPTPAPAPASAPYEARHGAGYTTFLHHSHGLAQHLQLFAPRDAPVKIVRLRVSNLWRRPRRITVTSFIEWVLGNHRDTTAPHVVTELAAQDSAILARETFSSTGASRVAFHAASAPLHGATADRMEFLAGPRALRLPPALERVGLGEAFGAAYDPCSALQLHLDIPPGEERTVHFLLGEGTTREEALAWIRRFRDPGAVEEAWSEVRTWWEEFLGRVQVRTPEPALDVLLNRWLPYQALTCRLHARSALYQSSGAFGFRDQLQDVLSFLFREPALARERILDAAAHQFEEGDVLHWWHPETGAGVRTRCSDDLLWLPRVTAEYVEATGDHPVLDEAVAFLRAPPLDEGERERYEAFPPGPANASLYEHCVRALRRGATRGRHGLPLMGTGDWNDGMDRVGEEGRGESVWLAWFLLGTLRAFRPLAEDRGDDATLRLLDEEDARLREAVEAHGWDGGWYRRGYFDDGAPLGTASADECRIDSLTQSWAVLSGAARPDRARRALDAVLRDLVRERERLILLLAPPFDRTDREPGYIKAYPPGIRENGGQYTHAAIWAAWAFTLV
ncbi:MAG: glucoamylase family protein, partial [Gemmatimonadota bacterium]